MIRIIIAACLNEDYDLGLQPMCALNTILFDYITKETDQCP